MKQPLMVSVMGLMIAFTLPASATQIPNLSLSQDEMAAQPAITTNSGNRSSNSYGSSSTNPYSPDAYKSNSYGANGYGVANAPKQGRYYMDAYCDENFTPLLANNPQYARVGDCIKQQKQQVCAGFAALPDDVKQALDDTISCANRQGSDETQADRYVSPRACTGSDTTRIQLMQKYWRDQNTVYALVFMPDDVLDGNSRCIRGGR